MVVQIVGDATTRLYADLVGYWFYDGLQRTANRVVWYLERAYLLCCPLDDNLSSALLCIEWLNISELHSDCLISAFLALLLHVLLGLHIGLYAFRDSERAHTNQRWYGGLQLNFILIELVFINIADLSLSELQVGGGLRSLYPEYIQLRGSGW